MMLSFARDVNEQCVAREVFSVKFVKRVSPVGSIRWRS